MLHRSDQIRLLVCGGAFVFGGAAGSITSCLCSRNAMAYTGEQFLVFLRQAEIPFDLIWCLLLPGICAFCAGSVCGVILLPVLDAVIGFFAAFVFTALRCTVSESGFVPVFACGLFCTVPCMLCLSAYGLAVSRGMFRCLAGEGRRSMDTRPLISGLFLSGLFLVLISAVFLLLLKRLL